jgi:hypothetical protein
MGRIQYQYPEAPGGKAEGFAEMLEASAREEARKTEEVYRLEERGRQLLEEIKQREAQANLAEASIKMRETAVRRQEAEVNLKGFRVKAREEDVCRWEEEVRSQEAEARHK